MAPGMVGTNLVRANNIEREHAKSINDTKLNSGICLQVSLRFCTKLSCKGTCSNPRAKLS